MASYKYKLMSSSIVGILYQWHGEKKIAVNYLSNFTLTGDKLYIFVSYVLWKVNL